MAVRNDRPGGGCGKMNPNVYCSVTALPQSLLNYARMEEGTRLQGDTAGQYQSNGFYLFRQKDLFPRGANFSLLL